MKALFYNFLTKKFKVKDISLPKISIEDVLVQVKSSALCGTDLHIMDGPLSHKAYNKKEIILGHSFSGVISRIGKGVKNFSAGDRVFASDFVWCGECDQCRNGRENLCDRRFVFGMEKPGSHAEYIAVPARAVFELPDSISFEAGSLITDLLALACHAVKMANAKSNQQICILGAGPVGLAIAEILKVHGFKNICLSDPIAYRKELAGKMYGFAVKEIKAVNNFTDQFDIVFDACGDSRALQNGYQRLKRGGKIVLVGVSADFFKIKTIKWVSRELSLLGIFDFDKSDIKEALALVKTKKINLDKMITHRFSLKEGDKAYRLLKNRMAGKIIISPQE